VAVVYHGCASAGHMPLPLRIGLGPNAQEVEKKMDRRAGGRRMKSRNGARKCTRSTYSIKNRA